MIQDLLQTPVEYLKGVGPKRAELLKNEAGIFVFSDLLEYYPFRYVDRSKFYTTSEISADMPYIQLRGFIKGMESHGKPRTTRITAFLTDSSGSVQLVWFNSLRWIKNAFDPKVEYIVFGKPSLYNNKINIVHPEVEPVTPGTLSQQSAMQAMYNSSEKLKQHGLDSRGISKLLQTLLPQVLDVISETLPESIISTLRLVSRKAALQNIHFPSGVDDLQRSVFRLKFEELFFLQLSLLKYKQVRSEKLGGYVFPALGKHFNEFYENHLPFHLTEAQKRVIREIRRDTLAGKQMNRLLQGDVGSGKTIVALMCMLMALDNGFQACLMAPTEILAFQHVKSLQAMLEKMHIRIGILTGSTPQKQRTGLLKELKEGTMQIIVGTHALIEDGVEFHKLGIVVIDEQHRFGVAQRAKLWSKGSIPPHVLVMTATPIPRTLAMTLYGDLDVSVINELPPGRKPIKTSLIHDNSRLRLFAFMKEQIRQGRQVYVVYPLINESEALDLKDLTDGYESIVREFPLPRYAVSMVHGKMKPADKEYEMKRFVKGETQIMVATTVIEVGIDVPNATIMVIESAERFGLSQLHQLRGRVGRGGSQSYCILVSSHKLTNEGRMRLEAMVNTNDGFEISEIDLRLRGPGDLQGTQQSGILELKVADLSKDEQIVKSAREHARNLLEKDPNLQQPGHRIVANRMKELFKDRLFWSQIS